MRVKGIANVYLIRCSILVSTSLAFVACSSKKDSTDASTSASTSLDVGWQGGEECDGEADDGECFLADRVARGFALAPVPLRLEGQTRQQRNRIGYGAYLLNAISACRDCHVTDGYFSGGRVFNLGARGLV